MLDRQNVLRLILAMLIAALPAVTLAQGDTAKNVDIPAGTLSNALDALGQQTGVQLVYPADRMAGRETTGLHGAYTPSDALDKLLEGSGFSARRDPSGAWMVVPGAPARTAKPSSPPAEAPQMPSRSGSTLYSPACSFTHFTPSFMFLAISPRLNLVIEPGRTANTQ